MTTGLLEQLRIYGEDFATTEPVTLDEVITREPAPPPFRPARPARRLPGWAYAVIAGVIVLVIGTGLFLLDRLWRETPPAQITTTAVTTTTFPPTTTLPTTTTAPPDTTSTTTAPRSAAAPGPRPYLMPRMVDVPGEGVLVEVDVLWFFHPDTGWTFLEKGEGMPGVWIWGYDPESGLAWGDDPTGTEESGGIGEMWTYAPLTGEHAHVETVGAISTRENLVGGFSAVLDIESRHLIFVGGGTEGGTVETWALDLDAKTWKQMNPGVAPNAHTNFPMAYDVESDRIILFGGWHVDVGKSGSDDTWAYDFNTDTWTLMDPPVSPRPSHSGTMTYVPLTDRVILFGGVVTGLSTEAGGEALDDTWTYDFNSDTWTEIVTSTSPSNRNDPGMVYDAETGLVVLFGGGHSGHIRAREEYNDVWLFDPVAKTWTEWIAPGGEPGPVRETTTKLVYGMPCAEAEFFDGGVDSDRDGEFTLSLEAATQSWCVDVSNVALGEWAIDIDVDAGETIDVMTIVLRDAFSPGDACAEVHPETVTGSDNIYTLSGINSLGPDGDGINGCEGDGPWFGDDDPAFSFLVFASVTQDNNGTMTVTYPTR